MTDAPAESVHRAPATKRLIPVLAGTLVLALWLTTVGADPAAATGGGFITNGTVSLGVHDEGQLNVSGGSPSLGGTTTVGLRYNATNAEFTAPGCLCEGWGAADAISLVSGSANEAIGVFNLTVVDATFTASSALSVVDVGATLRVTHDYHPSTVPELYEVTVTIKNISDATIEPRYRRVMDWDIEPTAFAEHVTIQGTAAADKVLFASDDGFASADPLSGPTDLGLIGDGVDVGPDDHGALFDFGFDELAPGESHTFNIFYGGAATESQANDALAAVGAEVFSYGQPSTERGPQFGEPNTAIFAFGGVGGEAQFPAAQFPADGYTVDEGIGHASIPLELTAPAPETELAVRVMSEDGTATAGSDYSAVDTIAVFPPGATTTSIQIPIIDDDQDEPDETIVLRLKEVTLVEHPAPALLGLLTETTVTILDDDEDVEPGGPSCPGFEGDPRPQVIGTPGPDTLSGSAGNDVICGLGGNDIIRGRGGDDVILGGAGNDRIYAESGADTVAAGPGVDYVEGNDGPDVLSGGRDNDQLRGGRGDDTLRGERGNDRLAGEEGADTIDGGADLDLCLTDGSDPATMRCP